MGLTIYLLAQKWRGSINIVSMRWFANEDELGAHLREHPPEHWDSEPKWHAYRVSNDGKEAQSLTLKECRAIGLRPLKTTRVER